MDFSKMTKADLATYLQNNRSKADLVAIAKNEVGKAGDAPNDGDRGVMTDVLGWLETAHTESKAGQTTLAEEQIVQSIETLKAHLG